MGSYSIHRFLTQGFITLLLVNVVQLSTLEKNVTLSREVQAEADHVRMLGRIVNGSEATLTQFPSQVSLRNTLALSHFCGGTIIDARWILTAAHCLFLQSGAQRQPWEITIIAGDLWLNQTSVTSQRSMVREIIMHEDYDRITLENDIALLRLWTSLTFTNRAVQYQVLQKSVVSAGAKCQLSGWGYPAEDIQLVTNELMYVHVPIISKTLCRELYADFSDIPHGMICAGYIEGQKDGCQGDSGGGLICDGILTGIVSWGEGCARPHYPGVYTDVKHYRNWILERSGIDDRANGANTVQLSLCTKFILFAVVGITITSWDN